MIHSLWIIYRNKVKIQCMSLCHTLTNKTGHPPHASSMKLRCVCVLFLVQNYHRTSLYNSYTNFFYIKQPMPDDFHWYDSYGLHCCIQLTGICWEYQFGTKPKLVAKILATNFGFVPDWLYGIIELGQCLCLMAPRTFPVVLAKGNFRGNDWDISCWYLWKLHI